MITVPLVLLGTSHSIRDVQQASECAARIENFLNMACRLEPNVRSLEVSALHYRSSLSRTLLVLKTLVMIYLALR